MLATVLGFTGAMVLGTAVAAALWWWNTLYRVLDPYLVVANAMPKTAFVPIFYIWLGATLSIYGMSLAISVFITILMIYSGFQGIDPNKIKLAQTFGATKGQILRKVVLPGSVPTLLAALLAPAVQAQSPGERPEDLNNFNWGLVELIEAGAVLIGESHLEHLKGVVELFHGARTDDRRGDAGLVLAPEKRKLALRQTTLLRQRRERAGHLDAAPRDTLPERAFAPAAFQP